MGSPKTSSARVKELLDLGMGQEAMQMIDHMPYEEVSKLAALFKVSEDDMSGVPSEAQPTDPEKPSTEDVSDTETETPPATPVPTEGEPTTLEGSKEATKKTAEESCGSEAPKKEESKEETKDTVSESLPVDETAPALNADGSPTPEAEKAARLGYISGLQRASQAIITRAAERKAMEKHAAANPQVALQRLLDELL